MRRVPACQPRRHRAQGSQGWERDWRRRWFFSNMSDTLETGTLRRVSHHCCGTDQHLQAAGGGLG